MSTNVKKVKTRIQNKCDTTQNWSQATDFLPLKGEAIVISNSQYVDTDNATEAAKYPKPRIKIGDGLTKLQNLPFINATNVYTCDDHVITCYPETRDTIYLCDSQLNGTKALTLRFPFAEWTDMVNRTNAVDQFDFKVVLLATSALSPITVNVETICSYAVTGYKAAQSIYTTVQPTKCILDNWTVADNVVGSGNSTLTAYETIRNSTAKTSSGSFSYQLSLPKDKGSNGLMYKSGMFIIDVHGIVTANQIYLDFNNTMNIPNNTMFG
jgi:hypothetical protein